MMKNKIVSMINYSIWALRYSTLNILAILAVNLFRVGGKYRNAWLIAELPGEARDNGYWLYEYIVESHPEVNVYYAIQRKSSDYRKLSAKDSVIEYGSFGHYVAHVLCVKSISSHIYGASPGRYFCRPFLPLMTSKKEIFLQHGILANVINLRGFSGTTIYTADRERDLFKMSGHVNTKNLKQTGLARFDKLIDTSTSSNILVIMPTFRSYLRNLSYIASDEEFISSTYYLKWNALLSSPDFVDTIEKHNLEVVFYPHRQMQAFNHLWGYHKNVVIGSPEEYDIQELLTTAKIMITDYSSTYYDFMYMKKPAILYQFDKSEVIGAHYKGSGEYPMGVKATTESDVVDALAAITSNDYKVSDIIKKEIEAFYPFRDSKNRERIFNVIMEEE